MSYAGKKNEPGIQHVPQPVKFKKNDIQNKDNQRCCHEYIKANPFFDQH